jgi:exopolysaccharide biosynthesis polyprenyl glycosylphosphotransferase
MAERIAESPVQAITDVVDQSVSSVAGLAPARRLHERAARLAPGARVVADSHGQRDSVVRRMLVAADALAVTGGLVLMAFVPVRQHPSRIYFWGVLTLPVWLALFKSYGLYDRDVKRINHSTVDDVPWIFHSIVVGCVLMWLYYTLLPPNGVVFRQLAAFGFVCATLMLVLRFLVRGTAIRLLGGERVALVGHASELGLLARKLKSHPEYGAVPMGFVSVGEGAAGCADLPLLGTLASGDLSETVREHRIERVVVSRGELDQETMLALVRNCRELGVKVSVLPGVFEAIGSGVEVDDVEGVTVLGMSPAVLSRSSRVLKRGMDLLGALVLLLLTAPIQLVIALAIKLDDGGPVLFRQSRVGRWDRHFDVIKFRTMCVDAEAKRAELLAQSKDPGWLLLDHDPRITRVGRFLRLTSLDELPQVWNVLRGEMSLVGPRPLMEADAINLSGWRRSRLDLKPGLTGLWQVLGRTSIPFEEMVKLDYLYVTNWSLWNDLLLILRTPAVLVGARAHGSH